MLRASNSFSIRCVVVLLLLTTLLTFSVGRVIPVSALAEEIPAELAPVFDTQIYQFTDYVEESLTDPQKGILYLLLGAWVCAQGGMNEYELIDPYTTSDGVRGWLKSTGITLYNQMLAFTGGHIYDPITGTDLTPLLSGLAGYALGAATKASQYQTENDFINDVETSEHYFVPYDPVLQQSINAYFGRKGGLWNWQFNEKPFETNFNWVSLPLGAFQATYDTYVNELSLPRIQVNEDVPAGTNYYVNEVWSCSDYDDLIVYLDSSTGYYGVYSLSNQQSIFSFDYIYVEARKSDNVIRNVRKTSASSLQFSDRITLSSYDTIVEAVRAIYATPFHRTRWNFPLSKLAPRCFVGTSWANKQEIFNFTNLNFAQNDVQSYNQVPDNTLLDIKGLLVDILDNTDLFQIVIDNLFKPDGTLNIDLPTIKVSINLPDTNPLPVNLNEVALYLDNDYLDIVKQSATDYGNTIGQWFVFWHNSDPVLLYTLLGSAIVILIGAFIGKWGHS